MAQPEFLFGAGAQALSAVGVAIGVGQVCTDCRTGWNAGQPWRSAAWVRHACCMHGHLVMLCSLPRPQPPPHTFASPPQAVFSAAAKLCIRSLGSTEPVASIIFAMAAVSSAGSALFCTLLPRHFVVPRTASAWGLLVAAGLLGCCVQLLATTALKLSRAAPVIAMSYFAGALRVPQGASAWAELWGWMQGARMQVLARSQHRSCRCRAPLHACRASNPLLSPGCFFACSCVGPAAGPCCVPRCALPALTVGALALEPACRWPCPAPLVARVLPAASGRPPSFALLISRACCPHPATCTAGWGRPWCAPRASSL